MGKRKKAVRRKQAKKRLRKARKREAEKVQKAAGLLASSGGTEKQGPQQSTFHW